MHFSGGRAILASYLVKGMQRFVCEIMKKSWVWNDFLKNMCSKDLNFTQKLDSFGEALFFYPVANIFSQTNCQIPKVYLNKNVPRPYTHTI